MFDLKKFKQTVQQEVESNILEYWMQLIDEKEGGFHCYSDFSGVVDHKFEKSVLLHSRILWSFSAAYRILPKSRYLSSAKQAYQFLRDKALDRQSGGVYWMLKHNGEVLDSQKHVYNQSFAIYALSEYYRASNDEEALELAIDLFKLIEKYAFDCKNRGYYEAFDETWTPIDNHLVCDTKEGVLAQKSMNTHLHIMEAYANLYRVWPNNLLETRISELLVLFKDVIINPSLHYGLFFSDDWKCLSKDTSYGHDIEGTWLMDDAATLISNKDLAEEIFRLTSDMAMVTLKEGLDKEGAVFNELHDGHLLDTDRIWWVQAESMVGFFNAFEKDLSKHELLQASFDCWHIISKNLIDKERGEWYWKTDRYGNPYTNKPKIEPWKCPYHNSRACLEIFSRVSKLER